MVWWQLSVKNPLANIGDMGLIPGLGRSPGEGNCTPLQYSCLGNPMEREDCQATVHGVEKEQDMSQNTTVLSHICDPFCDTFVSPPGSSVCGISQARIMEGVTISFSRLSSRPRDRTCISCMFSIGRQIHFHCATCGAQIRWYYSTILKFFRDLHTVPIVIELIYIPTIVPQASLFFTSSPTFVTCCLFDNSHSDICEMISHCGFDLHFPDDQ